nr:carbohydrate kinase [Sulfuriferula nivalis]
MHIQSNSNEINTQSKHQSSTIVLFGEVLADKFPDRSVLGGAPFNVACHLQAFGLHPVLVTRVGNDYLRDELLASMVRSGMDTSGVQYDPVHPTGQVVVHMTQDGHRFEISPEQAYDYIDANLAHLIASAVKPALIYFGTLAQRHHVSKYALNQLLQNVNVPHMLDINLREPWYNESILTHSLQLASIVKMNQDELISIVQQLKLPGEHVAEQAAALIKHFALERLIVTNGAEGAWEVDTNGISMQVKGSTLTEALIDTVGAGDGFAAVCILGMLQGWTSEHTLSRANYFAAAICGIRGAIPENSTFYQPFRNSWGIG